MRKEAEQKSTDATKKFAEDLTACDKEYQGLTDLLAKYEDFYAKLDCVLAEVNQQKAYIDMWYEGKVNNKTQTKIFKHWTDNYESVECVRCCEWVQARDKRNSLLDCLRQSEKIEEDAKEDFEAIKNFEKTFKEKVTDLKSIYDKAKIFNDARRYQSVYAESIEFEAAYSRLGYVDTWNCKHKHCNPPRLFETGNLAFCAQLDKGELSADLRQEFVKSKIQLSPKATVSVQVAGNRWLITDKDPEKQYAIVKWQDQLHVFTQPHCKEPTPPKDGWTPSVYKAELNYALRELIIAKYQRFRWHQQWIDAEERTKTTKEACEKFRKTRRDEFIQEAEDIPREEDTSATVAPEQKAEQKDTQAQKITPEEDKGATVSREDVEKKEK
ncbi:MAG: hypothetical protein AB7G75_04650 [Candidatus Binatia bacterium]